MAWILASDGQTLQWTGPGPAPYVPTGDQNALRAQIRAAGGAPQPGPASQQFGVVSQSPGAPPVAIGQGGGSPVTLGNIAQLYGSSTPQQGAGTLGQLAQVLGQLGLAQQYNSGPNLQAIYGTSDIGSIKGWTLAPDGQTLKWTGPGPAPYVPWNQQNALRQQIASSGGAAQASPAGSRYGGFVPAPGGVPVFIDPLTGLPLAAPPTGNDEQRNVLATGGVWNGLSPQAQQTFNQVVGPYEAEILKQKPGDPYASRVVNALGGLGGAGGGGFDASGLGGFAGQLGASSGQAGASAGGGGGQNLISPQFGATGQTIDYALAAHALSGFNLPSRIPRSEPGNPTVFNPFVGHERSASNYPLSPNTSDLLHQGNLFGPQAIAPSQRELSMLGSQYLQGVPFGYGASAAMQSQSPGLGDYLSQLPFGNAAYAPLQQTAPAGSTPVYASDGSIAGWQNAPGTGTPPPTTPTTAPEIPNMNAPGAAPGGVGPNFDWNGAYQQYLQQQQQGAHGAASTPMTPQQYLDLYAPKTTSPDNFGGQFGGPVIQRGATPGYTGIGALAYSPQTGQLVNPAALNLGGGNNRQGGLGVGLGNGPGVVNGFQGLPGFGPTNGQGLPGSGTQGAGK